MPAPFRRPRTKPIELPAQLDDEIARLFPPTGSPHLSSPGRLLIRPQPAIKSSPETPGVCHALTDCELSEMR